MAAQRQGVFGGTFNPIHLGHLHIATRVMRTFQLSRVHFVVSTTPPHKSSDSLLSFSHRYAMVALATSGVPSFIPSPLEMDPPASPYSVHTMRKLSRRTAGQKIQHYFIAGADSLLDVADWRESKELLSSYHFVFVSRPGIEAGDAHSLLPSPARNRLRDLRALGPRQLRKRVAEEQRSTAPRIYVVDVGAPDISASRVRRLASSGRYIRHLVPAPVQEYIKKHQLYGER